MSTNGRPPRNKAVGIITLHTAPDELRRMLAQASGEVPLLIDDDQDDDFADATTEVISPHSLGRRPPSLFPPEPENDSPLPGNVDVRLEVVGGPATGAIFELVQIETRIGRACSLVAIEDLKLSRYHATLLYDISSAELRVIDGGSANGTYLNGAKVSDYRLKHGDRLLLGATTLRVYISVR